MNVSKLETLIIELNITDANRIEGALSEFLAARDKNGTPSDSYDLAAEALRDSIVRTLNK